MDITLFQWGQFLTFLMIAIALGMDAFSLGIGVGMVGMRLREVVGISVTIGLFHFAMPLVGILIGMYLSELVGDIAALVGGAVLTLLGLNMLWNGMFGGAAHSMLQTSGIGLFLFAFSVSLDALPVGLSFGLMNVDRMMAVSLFGLIGALMAGCGLLLGRRVGGWLGGYSELLGGLILLVFGLKFMA
ncbi:manganese efflux pump MntP family protein [Brevibacillus marinus]|uniref:manganese efflux pump MntP n=1 Tax=Brevibacillus marinus TaxID=2496837 RepID=UPI000F8233A4|nr:manganese efflux pump MntP family protein [Brevibacillus marinus]